MLEPVKAWSPVPPGSAFEPSFDGYTDHVGPCDQSIDRDPDDSTLFRITDEPVRCTMYLPGRRVCYDMSTPRPRWLRRFFWWALLGVVFEDRRE